MQLEKKDLTIVYFSKIDEGQKIEIGVSGVELKFVEPSLNQQEYSCLLENIKSKYLLIVDGGRVPTIALSSIIHNVIGVDYTNEIGYMSQKEQKIWLGCIQKNCGVGSDIVNSPVFIGERSVFLKAYGGDDLGGDVLTSIGYSLQKDGDVKFKKLKWNEQIKEQSVIANKCQTIVNYFFKIPFSYLTSGSFFREIFTTKGKVQRDMLFRMLFLLFACFTFVSMPYISKDYGISGDEFVDHRHTSYVMDYFTDGDKTAINQPKTALHLYGISVQVMAGVVCEVFNLDDCYAVRHVIGALVGALGILFVGLLGLRWGGGLCGLLSILFMFFTPRFLGHSMNNLKDIPFAVGYIMCIYYSIRLFDFYPYFRKRDILGCILGIALALGTRSGGLILYPMVFMYAGLFYIKQYGLKELYKLKKYWGTITNIFAVLLIIIGVSYLLAIALWPFALEKPFSNVLASLSQFTNFSIGLRTIFDGEQMMSSMLPWRYAPKYLMIGMPLIVVIGFVGYLVYMIIKRKEFSLIAYFLLFSAIFPVVWVIYKNSNLYGGIRHLLFVMPPMVVIAARFWSEIIHYSKKYSKISIALVVIVLLSFPVIHTLKNHPNQYVYFNELAGGLKGSYGDYETDYYYNSLKESSDWLKQNVDIPKDRKTIIVTNHIAILEHYFRKDTNIQVIYSRYYDKYSKNWDYAIFANVYINRFQLRNNLFPPKEAIYAPLVDGYPMSFVLKRDTKQELQGFKLEKERRYMEALEVFESYVVKHKFTEEVWSRMGKLYFITKQYSKADAALKKALQLHPSLNEALYMTALLGLEENDSKKSLQAVDKMLAENSSSPDAWYLKAMIYYKLKQYQTAISSLNRVLSMRPNMDKAHVLAGDIFRDNNNYKQAVSMYQNATKYSNTINTNIQIADMFVRMKNYPEAEKILQQTIKAQPTYYPIYKVQSRMYVQQGKLKEAEQYLEMMESIVDDPEIFVIKAIYYKQVDNKEAAKSMIERALALDSGYVEALKLKQGLNK